MEPFRPNREASALEATYMRMRIQSSTETLNYASSRKHTIPTWYSLEWHTHVLGWHSSNVNGDCNSNAHKVSPGKITCTPFIDIIDTDHSRIPVKISVQGNDNIERPATSSEFILPSNRWTFQTNGQNRLYVWRKPPRLLSEYLFRKISNQRVSYTTSPEDTERAHPKFITLSDSCRRPGGSVMYELRRNYYWPHIANNVYTTVSSCVDCHKKGMQCHYKWYQELYHCWKPSQEGITLSSLQTDIQNWCKPYQLRKELHCMSHRCSFTNE